MWWIVLLVVLVVIFIAWWNVKKNAQASQTNKQSISTGTVPGRSTDRSELAADTQSSTESASTSPEADQAAPASDGPEPATGPAPAGQATGTADVPEKISEQVRELEQEQDPVGRHRLLQNIAEAMYRDRKDPPAREACRTFSAQHMQEFGAIAGPLAEQNGGKLPHVPTFQNYANLLTEDGQYDQAIKVCEQALEHGLDDKTKTGFTGRIERIKAQQEKAD